MRSRLLLPSCSLLALLAACADDASVDAGLSDLGTVADLGSFADAEVSTADSGLPRDAGAAPDAEPAADVEGTADAEPAADAEPSADAEPATDAGGPLQAVLDTRCRYFERVGLVTVINWGGPDRYLDLSLYDAPPPWLGPPTSADAACEFHRASQGPCSCGSAQVCSYQNTCVAPPVAAPAVTLTLTGNGGTQTLNGDGAGTLSGVVTVPDDALGLRLVAGSLEITVPPMSIPPALINPSGTLSGDYETPTAIDLSWTAPASPGHVYSHTNINHHVAEPTFTTCVVPASAQSLHIDGAMLQPLSVVTGLEFQAIEHIRFASVETPAGCVEFRFSRPEFVNLQ